MIEQHREEGSALLASLVMIVILAGMCSALQMSSVVTFKATQETIDLQDAARNAESGLAYYLTQLELDQDTFVNDPAPRTPQPLGEGSFQLVESTPEGTPGVWELGIESTVDGIDYRTVAVVGFRRLEIPHGIVVAGTGSDTDVTLTMSGNAELASYDPTVGTSTIRDNAGMWVNGSLALNGTADVMGEAAATGTITAGSNTSISGDTLQGGPTIPVDTFEDVAEPLIASTKASNDNDTLAKLFGAQWTPVAGSENYGDLVITGGDYVIPAGDYRIRSLRIEGQANVTFDTSGGSTNLVFVGDGMDPLTVTGQSNLWIDAGGTDNGLMTVLGENSSFLVESGSTFGQEVTDSYNAGYSQIVSAGGAGSVSVKGTSNVFGRLGAPNLDLELAGSATWYGGAVVQTATLSGSSKSSPKFMVDEGLQGTVMTDPDSFEVYTRWRETTAPDFVEAPTVTDPVVKDPVFTDPTVIDTTQLDLSTY